MKCFAVLKLSYFRIAYGLETEGEFEKLIRRTTKKWKANASGRHIIVVHVINKGESAGAGSNISSAQIVSQISVLDFNRTNSDTTSTPEELEPAILTVLFLDNVMLPEGESLEVEIMTTNEVMDAMVISQM